MEQERGNTVAQRKPIGDGISMASMRGGKVDPWEMAFVEYAIKN
jgi:hypothetical protein